jgi:hypothetical protein
MGGQHRRQDHSPEVSGEWSCNVNQATMKPRGWFRVLQRLIPAPRRSPEQDKTGK